MSDDEQPRYPFVHVDVPAAEADLVSLQLWELGAAGVEERDGTTFDRPHSPDRTTLVGSFADQAAAEAALGELSATYPARLEFVVGDAWRDGWRAHFKPLRVGERIVIRPSWEAYAAQPDDVVLTLDPGGAFGTGTHESTQLVLQALQGQGDAVRACDAVLDVGCGSGILSVAALLLGAQRAVAIDLDPAAIEATAENAEVNGVAARMQVSDTPLEAIEGRYPLVLANIEAHVLVPIAAELAARVAPGGLLMLSGILSHQGDDVLAAYPGFECVLRQGAGDWVALTLRAAR